jgi:hypothetical protein
MLDEEKGGTRRQQRRQPAGVQLDPGVVGPDVLRTDPELVDREQQAGCP